MTKVTNKHWNKYGELVFVREDSTVYIWECERGRSNIDTFDTEGRRYTVGQVERNEAAAKAFVEAHER